MSIELLDNILEWYVSVISMNADDHFVWRVIASLFSALFISLGTGFFLIRWLCNLRAFQMVRVDGPILHVHKKQDIPTMGGIMILVSVITSIIMWSDLNNIYIWYVLFILIMYGILGLIDDLLKIKRASTVGVSALYKYFWQSLIVLALIVIMYLCNDNIMTIQVTVPFFKRVMSSQLDIWYIVLVYFIVVGTSNAVNLSDGLDGLAIVPIMLISVGLAIIACLMNSIFFSNYFNVPYLYLSGELIIVCATIVGAGLGFLWFNTYPAQIFMGDVGSLSLGGAIGLIAVLLHQEFALLIMGGVFFIEMLSVILQVGCYKLFGRRIFRMAPIHHHFELKGSPEPRIVVRFWIVSLILVLSGLIIVSI